MTVPVHDDFTVPVVLQGADSTRVWRGRGQTLVMSPAGITFERRGKTVQLEWRDITGIDMVNMSGSFRIVFNAWAICAQDVDAIYPHEFEKDWPTGQIGALVGALPARSGATGRRSDVALRHTA